MATPQLSPGVLVREVDLTKGRVDNVLDNIGAIAGPFAIGPVNECVQVDSEQALIDVFGKPQASGNQYEYWMSASSYLSYGGVLKVVRASGTTLNNANAGVGIAATTTLLIENYDDYSENHDSATDFTWSAKNPGTWADNLKVCVIDDFADQTLGITTTDLGAMGVTVGAGVTAAIAGATVPGSGSTSSFTGYLKGIVTGFTTSSTGASTIDVKIVSRVEAVGGGATETQISYQEGTQYASFDTSDTLVFVAANGTNTGSSASSAVPVATAVDWYDQQTLGLTNSTVFWKSIAPRPTSNNFVTTRNGYNDGIHVVVVDDKGSVTGIQGNILEKHISLSKASDTISAVNSPLKVYYKDYVADFSANVFAGKSPSAAVDAHHGTTPVATGFTAYTGVPSASFTAVSTGDGTWGQLAQGVTFSAIGNVSYTLSGGKNYGNAGATDEFKATLGNLQTAYSYLSNKDEVEVDYLIMGPGCTEKAESQAKANYLISLAE